MDDRIAKLSDVQKQCLRLVAKGRSSKEIAPLVGLTHQTVDQYLHRARVALGAVNRREAARIFAETERASPFKEFELKPAPVENPAESVIYDSLIEQPQRPAGLFGFPSTGGTLNDLSPAQRLISISKIALYFLICVLAMVILVRGAFVVLS